MTIDHAVHCASVQWAHTTSSVVSSFFCQRGSFAVVGSTISTAPPPQQKPHPLRRGLGVAGAMDNGFAVAGMLPGGGMDGVVSAFWRFLRLYLNKTCHRISGIVGCLVFVR